MLNVGLVGFGFAGKTFHAPVIRVVEGLCLTTIVRRHGGGAPDPRYADVDFVTSVDELLTRSVDLVVIATPNTSHHPIAKQCLLAGRHVVVDKPLPQPSQRPETSLSSRARLDASYRSIRSAATPATLSRRRTCCRTVSSAEW